MPHGSYEGSMLFDLTAGMGFIFDSEAAVANVRQPLCQPITLTPKITQLLSWDCTHTTTPHFLLPPSSFIFNFFFFFFFLYSPALLARPFPRPHQTTSSPACAVLRAGSTLSTTLSAARYRHC